MNNDTDIQLSGPFSAKDGLGRTREISAIYIFDEGYGIIDVYVALAAPMGVERLYQDSVLIGHILARLRALGYVGPDFGHGDLGLQDDKLIVLEAPEEFNVFAASKGWKNLAEEFEAPPDDASEPTVIPLGDPGPATSKLLDALVNKFKLH